MNRAEFIAELRKRLRKLPQDEQDNAIAYYEEYLDEAGPEGEQEALAGLGSPAQVAAELISGYAIKNVAAEPGEQASGGLRTLWIVLLAVFALPVALPLAIAAAAVVFSLLLCVFFVCLTLLITAIGLAVAGVAMAGFGTLSLFAFPIEALFCLGLGLVALSVGTALLLATIWLSRKILNGITKLFAGILERKGGRK
jgi:uncharacterized membrane protein